MKCTVLVETKEQNRQVEVAEDADFRIATLPYLDAGFLVCEGKCPCCDTQRFEIKGDTKSKVQVNDLVFVCVAYCTNCQKPVGTLKVEMETLFGLDEDRKVLQGRPRVY